MIEINKTYSIVCDRCREYYSEGEWETTDFEDLEQAEEQAEEAGWKVTHGKHICPDCQYEAEQYKTAEYFKPQESL